MIINPVLYIACRYVIIIYSLSCNHPLKSTQLQWGWDGTPQKLHQLLPFSPSCWHLMGVTTERGQDQSIIPPGSFVKTPPGHGNFRGPGSIVSPPTVSFGKNSGATWHLALGFPTHIQVGGQRGTQAANQDLNICKKRGGILEGNDPQEKMFSTEVEL